MQGYFLMGVSVIGEEASAGTATETAVPLLCCGGRSGFWGKFGQCNRVR